MKQQTEMERKQRKQERVMGNCQGNLKREDKTTSREMIDRYVPAIKIRICIVLLAKVPTTAFNNGLGVNRFVFETK